MSLHICVEASPFTNTLELYDIPERFSEYDGFTWLHPNLIVIGVQPDTGVDTIAHEAGHATFITLLDRGVELTGTNHEPFTYMLGYITKEIYDFINKEEETDISLDEER
jgi:hypothetical protein